MDKFDEQATNLLIDLGIQIAGKTKELEALRDRIGQFGRDVDREAREGERALLLATVEPQVFVESQNAVTEMRQHLAAVFECREELMRAVAGFDWGTSVSESYHNERMAAMDRLREAVK